VLQSDHADVAAALVAAFGPHVSLISVAPAGLMLEFAAGTLGGKHAETTEIPVAGAAPPGALFDYASIHIITTSTLRSFETAYPQGPIRHRVVSADLVVDCPDESGFVENAWVGHILAIGPELRVRVSIPCPRCVMTTLPRVDLPLDPAALRTVAQLNKLNLGDFGDLPCAGVYADVRASMPMS
jgi:hypothetical protein